MEISLNLDINIVIIVIVSVIAYTAIRYWEKTKGLFSCVRNELSERGKNILVAYTIIAILAGLIFWILFGFSKTENDFFSMLANVGFSALIAVAVFVIGMFLTKGSEKNIMKKLDKLDATMNAMNTTMNASMNAMNTTMNAMNTNMSNVMLKMLNMMEDDRNLPHTTWKDIESKPVSGKRVTPI